VVGFRVTVEARWAIKAHEFVVERYTWAMKGSER
jgi:hypothetical protein